MSNKGKQLYYVGNKQDYLLNGVNLTTAVAEEEEKTVSEDENQGDGYGVEVLVGDKDVANVDDELQKGITSRDIEVGHVKVVDHGFVGMLAVGGKNIASGKEPLGDSEKTIGQEDDDKADTADVQTRARIRVDIANKQIQHDKTHTDAAHIAGETACIGAEVEEAENEDGYHDGGDEFDVDKPVFKDVEIAESANHNKRIGGKHAVDAIHEVVDIEDSCKEHDEHDKLPRGYGRDIGPEREEYCGKLCEKAQPRRQRMHVVHKANHSQDGDGDEEIMECQAVGERVEQHGEVEDDAGSE